MQCLEMRLLVRAELKWRPFARVLDAPLDVLPKKALFLQSKFGQIFRRAWPLHFSSASYGYSKTSEQRTHWERAICSL